MATLQVVGWMLLVFILPFVSAAFTPSCSFFNGQCVYNVKLGHSGQCDSVQSGGGDSGSSGHLTGGDCTCNDVTVAKNDLSSLQGTVAHLQQAVDQLFNQLNMTKTDLSQTNHQVATATQNNADLLAVLHAKETALNRTNQELATILHTAGTEIQGLREKLQNASRGLAVCQGVINPNGHTTSPALNPDYTLFYCPFQSNSICGFTQDSHDTASWQHSKGSTHSTTGPREDHTYGSPSGYYMKLDSQSTATSSGTIKTALLESKPLTKAHNYCIRFWYNMYGTDVKNLNVYARVHGGLGNPIFSRTGNLGSAWHMAEIDLNDEYTATDFSIVFEASTIAHKTYIYHSGTYHYNYYNQNGDIAIDDFYAYNTSCNSVPMCSAESYKRMVGNTTTCVSFHSTPKSWFDANNVCKEESAHGHLMTVKDSLTQNYLIQLIQHDFGLMATGQSGYYISANDESSEGHFVWTDTGTPYHVNYTSWHVGQPNNVGSNQDCVLLEYPASDYEWGDVDCRSTHPFICEVTY